MYIYVLEEDETDRSYLKNSDTVVENAAGDSFKYFSCSFLQSVWVIFDVYIVCKNVKPYFLEIKRKK